MSKEGNRKTQKLFPFVKMAEKHGSLPILQHIKLKFQEYFAYQELFVRTKNRLVLT